MTRKMLIGAGALAIVIGAGAAWAHGQLMAALTGDRVDEAQLYAFADARAQDIKDLAKVIVPQVVKVHDALTPAQRQKLATRAQQMHQKHQQNQGGFGGPGE